MIRCTKCGTINPADATFCSHCNSYLAWTGEPIEDAASPAPEAPGSSVPSATGGMQDDLAPPPTGVAPDAAPTGAPPPARGAPRPTSGPPPSPPAPSAPPAARPTSVPGPGADAGPARVTAVPPLTAPPARQPSEPAARRPSAPAEQPASRRPTREVAVPKPRPKPVLVPPRKSDAPKPGDLVCQNCGTGNDPERRFCRRCGYSLVAAPTAPAAAPQVPWYRRLLGRGPRRPMTYLAGQRPTSVGGLRHWRPGPVLSFTGILFALGLGGVASYLAIPEVRGAADGVTSMLDCRISEVTRGTTLYPFTPEARSLRDHVPEHAADRDDETYWLGPRLEGDRFVYRVTFDRDVDLQRINVYAGVADEGGRPRRILVRAGNTETELPPLRDSNELQSAEACLRGVGGLTLVVLDAYPADAPNVAIRRLEFVTLK